MKTQKRGPLFILLFMLLNTLSSQVDAREPKKAQSNSPKAQDLIDKAWKALENEMNLKKIDEAIAYLENAVSLDPANDEILVELSSAYYHRGEQMSNGSLVENDVRFIYFQKGYETALKAITIKETAGAHFSLATNLACTKENTGLFNKLALFPTINKHMNWVMGNDKNYKYGAAARFWSGTLSQMPDIIVRMAGKKPEKVYLDIDNAIDSEPRFLTNYLFKAKLYHSKGKKEKALDLLEQALKMDLEIFPEERAYNRYAQQKAIKYWTEWTGKTYPVR